MKVFASRFLEEPTEEKIVSAADWKWTPRNHDAYRIYASGAPTKTRQLTYKDERDEIQDSDRPNEGMLAA